MPDGWEPDQAGRDFAVQTLGSGRAAHAELAKFLDHWIAKAGADACKVDWQAAWRTWVRRAVDYGGGGPGPPGRPAQNRPLSYAEALKRAVNSEPDLAEQPKFDLDLTATDVSAEP